MKHLRQLPKLFFTLLISCILFSTGCGSSVENTAPAETSSSLAKSRSPQREIDIDTEIKVPQRTDGTITLSLGFSTNREDPRGIASQQFKEEVEKNTNGTVQIALYPDSQKGNDSELITSITTGELDMTVSSAGNFTGYSNKVGISALPFLFDNLDEAWRFMDSDVAAQINKELEEYNIYVLAHFDNGFRCVTTKDHPINHPKDMKGLVIRTPDNAVVKETMSVLGASPYALGFSELYDSLKTGKFDAQENPIPIIYNNRFYEVQNCLAITNHSYDAMPFVISKEAYLALSDDEKKVIREAAIHAQTLNRQLNTQQTEEYLTKLETEHGMKITYPDLAVFKEQTKSVTTFFNYDEKLLASVKAAAQQK